MTERKLIYADDLLKKLDGVWDCNDMAFEPEDHICNVPSDCKGCKWRETLDFVKRIVKSSKTVDAVPVRCKDCKYWLPMDRFHQDYHPGRGECELNCWVRDSGWFCADGER